MSLEEMRGMLKRRRDALTGLRIAVLAGGSSAEREVSLISGQAVAAALHELGYHADLITLNSDNLTCILPDRNGSIPVLETLPGYSMVFTTLHGTHGEDGVWQGVFELLRLPYVSAGVKGSAIAMDKLISKRLFAEMEIPTPRYWVVRAGQVDSALVPADYTDLVAKPAAEGSSVGIEMLSNDSAGWETIHELASRYDPLLIEERIYGRELTCAVIGPAGNPIELPLVEIKPQRREFYDYTAKYTSGESEYICPAEVPGLKAREITEQALRIYREFDLAPYARIDCLLDAAGRHWFLEANTLPGFTPLSLLPMAALSVGVEFNELCELLMLCALVRREAGHAQ